MWNVKCSCDSGTIKTVRGSHLTEGNITSCGCVLNEAVRRRHDNHRQSMIGKIFGRLTITGVDKVVDNHTTYYTCQCSCGKTTSVSNIHLKDGDTTSCGCYFREVSSAVHITHGLSGHPLYNVHKNMIDRCHKQTDQAYCNYGARGISVCREWIGSLSSFIDWAENNGYQPGLTIERINNDGNYEPSNCRWVTLAEQARNKRTNVIKDMDMAKEIRYSNESNTDVADRLGIPRPVVLSIRSNKTWRE